MSLDITILDENGTPLASAPLGVDAHWELLELARARQLPRIAQLYDYYEDVDYAPEEVGQLLGEVAKVRESSPSPRLLQELEGIERLLKEAVCQHRAVSAIAD